jgi:hypothetical protein
LFPDKVKDFHIISLTQSTVAECTDNIVSNLRIQLCNICKHIEAFSIATNESTNVIDVAQLAVFIRGCDSKFVITEELSELVPMRGATTGKEIFCEVERLLQKYELPLNELLCLVTDGAPGLSGC